MNIHNTQVLGRKIRQKGLGERELNSKGSYSQQMQEFLNVLED
jgi:hypothetical protein